MRKEQTTQDPYWRIIWKQFYQHPLGVAGLFVVILFCLIGVYAPFLASGKPLVVYYDQEWFFPLFRYLVYRGYYTKRLDIFFNLLIFTLPCFILSLYYGRRYRWWLFLFFSAVQLIAFGYYGYGTPKDPSFIKSTAYQKKQGELTWSQELSQLSPYAKLNLVMRYYIRQKQDLDLRRFNEGKTAFPTLWHIDEMNEKEDLDREEKLASSSDPKVKALAESRITYIRDRKQWIEDQIPQLHYLVMPLLRPFHWEDDAGGGQKMNQSIGWLDLTRINRKDLTAALIFGTRISLTVGIISIFLALLIGIPVGALAGFYGGKTDILVSRLLEIWESMPTFFMLLMVVAVTQSKSIFLVIAIIGLFGWTGFSRYIRGEFFKQRHLSYVEACRSQGFGDAYIMFRHILPNAIPPLLTLLPFAIMGAISSEAGLSFLGLGEEDSCSWGVLMDEGRSTFPGESYLLWAPALMLTILLIAIALVGDALRDSLDPKMHKMAKE